MSMFKSVHMLFLYAATFRHGLEKRSVRYTGLFEIKLIPPHNAHAVFNNPLGVYITSFTWSRDFDAPVQTVR